MTMIIVGSQKNGNIPNHLPSDLIVAQSSPPRTEDGAGRDRVPPQVVGRWHTPPRGGLDLQDLDPPVAGGNHEPLTPGADHGPGGLRPATGQRRRPPDLERSEERRVGESGDL